MKNIRRISKSIVLAIIFFIVSFAFVGCDESKSESVWVAFDKSKITLTVGQSERLEVFVTPSNAKDASYVISTNNPNVVSVSQDGTITAVGVGIATVTVTSVIGANSSNCVVTVVPVPQTLAVPSNIRFDGEKIVWNRVDNRVGYKIKLNDEELDTISASEFFRGFSIGTENKISIKTVGNGSTYLDSEWSEDFIFTQLNAPILDISNGKITFSSLNNDENATYDLYLDGQLVKSNISTGFYVIPSTLATGTHIYKAKAVGNQANNLYTSTFSEEIVISRLSAPTNAVVSASMLTFDAVIGAESYMMMMTDTTNNTTKYQSLSTNSCYLGNDYVAGKYEIKLMSRGNWTTTIDSDYSTSVAIDKLDAPTNVKIENGIITWEQNVSPRNGFLVNIYDYSTTEQNVQIIPTAEYFYNFAEYFKKAGMYVVTIVATGDNANSETIRYINSAESEQLYITKLATPDNVNIFNNYLNWNTVDMSSSYEVLQGASAGYVTSNNYFDFTNTQDYTFAPGSHSVRVRALGNGTNIIESEYSDELSFIKLNSITKADFTISQSQLSWKNIENCIKYNVYINDETPIEVNSNKLDMNSAVYSELNYSIRVQALSSTNEYVMGEPSEAFTFQKLGTVTDISVVNGKLNWAPPSGTGIISSYRIKVGGAIYDTHNNATSNDLAFMTDGSTQNISIQAICNDNTNQFMWGNFSEDVTLTKLSSNFQAKITNGEYTWSKINNVGSYLITIIYSLDGLTYYGETMEFSASEDRALRLLELDFFNNPIQYQITIQALGITGGQYISSSRSSPVYTTRLAEVNSLRVEDGIIVWDYNPNVDYYEVIVNNTSIGNIGKVSKFELGSNYDAGDYDIKVFARGNQSTTLNAIETETPLSVTKLSNNFQISVNKNFVTWNSIANAGSYSYELRDEFNNIVSNNNSLLNNRVDLTNIEWNERYYFKVKANGDNTRFVSGDYAANAGEAFYVVKLLNSPTNLSVDNGILSWDYVPNATNYEIKISNIVNSDGYENVINYTKTDTTNRGSFDIASYAITNGLVGEIRVVIQSIGGNGIDAFLSSSHSDELRTYKLEAPTLSNVEGKLNWETINDSSSYNLFISSGASTTKIELSNSTVDYEMDAQFPAGNYSITLQAIGDEKYFLTSNHSRIFSAVKLATPIASDTDLRVKNGRIVWLGIPNAYLYQVDILKGNGLGSYVQYKNELLMPNNDDNSYLFAGEYGQYKMNIKVLGNTGTPYLNSSTYEYSNILTKLNAPNDMYVENGVLRWSAIEGVTSNGYSVSFNDYVKEVGQVTRYVLDEEFASIYYSVCITSIGDDSSKLTSDQSDIYYVEKINAQDFSIVNGELSWTRDYRCDHYELVLYNVNNIEQQITEEIDIETTSFSLLNYESGFYKAKIRFVSGNYTNEETGYINSDWSNEISIYKLPKAENFKLVNDFESADEEVLNNLGTLSWDSVENAGNYEIGYKPTSLSYFMYEKDILTNKYTFADNMIMSDIIGAYDINLTSYGTIVTQDNVEYRAIKSDMVSIIATKLATPENLYAENGCLYWADPNMGDELQNKIDFKYMLYWSYAEEDSEFIADSYESVFIDSGISHNILVEGVQSILRSYPLTKLGKYKLMLRAVGENCIRSDAIECTKYINYETELTTHYVYDLFSAGDGSEENPYVIKSFVKNNLTRTALEQLSFINYLPNRAFILQENINLDENFTPIGNKDELSTAFNGTFSGLKSNNKNCYIDASEALFNSVGNVGIFHKLQENAVVKNIDIQNMIINGTYNIIGTVTSENNGTIQNVNVTESKAQGSHTANNKMYVGGIAGINYGTISNCTTSIVLNTRNTLDIIYTGGITGYNEGTIYQCRTNQYVLLGTATNDQITGTMAGGIAGFNIGENARIQECSNFAMVKASTGGSSSGGISYGYAGGIVGKNAFNLDGNSGSVTTYPLVENCYNAGTICAFDSSSLSNSKAGGLVGFTSGGKIAYSYNSGDVYILDVNATTMQYNYAGGIIGHNDNNNSCAEYCYYMQKNFTQSIMPDTATSLNGSSSNIEIKTDEWLKTNLVSDKFVLVNEELQKLLWEVE